MWPPANNKLCTACAWNAGNMRNVEAVEGVARWQGRVAGVGNVEGLGAPANRDSLGARKGDENALAEETSQGGGGS